MLTVISAPPSITRPSPEMPKALGENLQVETERLRREVEAASTRNAATAKSTIETVQQVKTFEERARDTLRTLMDKMGEDNEGRR